MAMTDKLTDEERSWMAQEDRYCLPTRLKALRIIDKLTRELDEARADIVAADTNYHNEAKAHGASRAEVARLTKALAQAERVRSALWRRWTCVTGNAEAAEQKLAVAESELAQLRERVAEAIEELQGWGTDRVESALEALRGPSSRLRGGKP